ncbi:MAG: hypothetical protein NZ889_01930 [Candidatus Pacearchaeota archaeon]|nr:hypothetical protein [Candidatus Pacearchaeota archaeon]
MIKQSGLSEIKKRYKKLEKKYKLPNFSELNKEFDVEKVQERETDFLLREIRRVMSDKVGAYLRFLELFLNPPAAPLFVLISLKGMVAHHKEKIEEIYRELVKIEIRSIALDVHYEEQEEAKFIREVYKKWKEFKDDLKSICKEIENLHSKIEKKNKTYYG